MPERRRLRASEGQDVRSERPARGCGQPLACGANRSRSDRATCGTDSPSPDPTACTQVRPGTSMPKRSAVHGIRTPQSTSPAAQPAIMPTVSAMLRTRG